MTRKQFTQRKCCLGHAPTADVDHGITLKNFENNVEGAEIG